MQKKIQMKKFILILFIVPISFALNAKQPQRGYRGFVDWSNSIRSYEFNGVGRISDYYTGFSTIHGYQINPWIFTGVGFDLEYFSTGRDFIIAPFFDVRSDLKFNKITPFADVRIGYNYTDGKGVYFSPSLGYRFNWGRKVGVNLGIGLTLKGYKADIIDIEYNPGLGGWGVEYIGTERRVETLFSFRIGIDF